jgi:hypothetical protein
MNLIELESRLQTLVEVQLLSVLPGQKVEDLVIQKLAAAMHANLVTLEDGSLVAPNLYTIIVNPRAAGKWREPKLLDALIEVIHKAGEEAGFKFAAPPAISIATDKTLSPSEASVLASQRVEPMAETKGSPPESEDLQGTEHIPDNAFLIIEGVKVFPLKLSVINIGRRLDNQLVIDDPRVSRNHAQLRAINARFVLFDLNSTGGTFVNGQRANQTVLYPGDVISLAGVALIFGQDNPPPRPDLIETSPLQASTGERPTAILKDRSTAKMKKK